MQQDINILVEKAKGAADLMKQLSHESRLLILCFVSDQEKSVQEIEKFLGTSQSNTSQHLAKLRSVGLLKTNKIGNQVFYSINNPDVLKIIKSLQEIYCS
jgi:DNA-binding transcriptional ArsR family regulator